MARNRSAVVVLLAALALASGARVPLQAATSTTADVVFIMEAAQATFTNATTLALNGLAGSAQSYAAGAKTGIYPIQNFTDGSVTSQYVDSNGQWLSNPQAVMYGVDQTGAVTTVLLTLSNPTVPQQPAGTVTNNNNNNNGGSTTTNNNNNGPPQLTFTVALVPAQASAVKYQNGVVAEKITEASNGAGNLTTSITPGATFSPVVIYIDQNQQGLPKKATTKWGYGGWGNGWNNGYYNNGWGYNSGYSSNNNNNNNNNGGWGANNNNNNNNNNGGWGASNNNNNNNNNNGGWGSSNNNNNNNNNGGWGSSNNNNNNNNNGK